MEKKSLFYPLDQEGLTTLRIQYNWKSGDVFLQASKDWDDDLDWSEYNQDGFVVESIKTKTGRMLNDSEVREMFEKYGLTDYLNQVIDLVKAGRHFGIDCFWNKKLDIKYLGNMHNRKYGINNTRHAIVDGGIRRHEKSENELDVIIDGLNLARAMSYKNIAGEVHAGGAKSCVIMDELDLNDMQQIGFLAFCMDELRCSTGPDMGFPPEMTDVMKDNGYSVQYTCGPRGPLGSSGPPTAYGVFISMQKAAKFLFGDESMTGFSFAVQGLGEVGSNVVKEIAEKVKDAKIYVADINEKAVRDTVDKYKAKGVDIEAADPAEILYLDVDVISPCAMGAVLNEESIPKLKCKMIWGSANNQIKASSIEEEKRLAKVIADRGILFQTDWWHNTAGVMFAYEEVRFQDDSSLDHVYQEIDRILPRITWENLNEAKEKGITPTENAYNRVEDIMFTGKVY
ncbi:MAG: Glu/Leu/Phe/Val dehydrogenase family protein [Anaerovoracaceae bacterium]|nr:Glu/Leu/Phe/Val dehydrogenase family protein [Anaerovoracaceae bacterium]